MPYLVVIWKASCSDTFEETKAPFVTQVTRYWGSIRCYKIDQVVQSVSFFFLLKNKEYTMHYILLLSPLILTTTASQTLPNPNAIVTPSNQQTAHPPTPPPTPTKTPTNTSSLNDSQILPECYAPTHHFPLFSANDCRLALYLLLKSSDCMQYKTWDQTTDLPLEVHLSIYAYKPLPLQKTQSLTYSTEFRSTTKAAQSPYPVSLPTQMIISSLYSSRMLRR